MRDGGDRESGHIFYHKLIFFFYGKWFLASDLCIYFLLKKWLNKRYF